MLHAASLGAQAAVSQEGFPLPSWLQEGSSPLLLFEAVSEVHPEENPRGEHAVKYS